MKRWFAPFVVGMVLLYSVLALGAAGCPFMPLMPRAAQEHDHHTPSHAEHSTLCAWACQVNPTVSLPTAAPVLAGFILVAMQRLVTAPSQARLFSPVSRSRAPPQ